jgi:hypothetical protein
MRNRWLTGFWIFAFATNAVGFTHALHLVSEGVQCHDGAASEPCTRSIEPGDPGKPALPVLSSDKIGPPGHDPSHCTLCQALAVLKALPGLLAVSPGITVSTTRAMHISESSMLAAALLAGFGPRAPPAAHVTSFVS